MSYDDTLQEMRDELARIGVKPIDQRYPNYLDDRNMLKYLRHHGIATTRRALRSKAGKCWDGGPGDNKYYECLEHFQTVPAGAWGETYDELEARHDAQTARAWQELGDADAQAAMSGPLGTAIMTLASGAGTSETVGMAMALIEEHYGMTDDEASRTLLVLVAAQAIVDRDGVDGLRRLLGQTKGEATS
jgi:hypothetical protein